MYEPFSHLFNLTLFFTLYCEKEETVEMRRWLFKGWEKREKWRQTWKMEKSIKRKGRNCILLFLLHSKKKRKERKSGVFIILVKTFWGVWKIVRAKKCLKKQKTSLLLFGWYGERNPSLPDTTYYDWNCFVWIRIFLGMSCTCWYFTGHDFTFKM